MAFRDEMPAMLKHAGVWQGIYIHMTPEGSIIDTHGARVECVYPEAGDYDYIQYNHFTWDDGREHKATLPGVFRDGRLWWDTETFRGYGWQTMDDIVLLNLERYDEPGAMFFEMITLGEGGEHRARTWQWFKDGQLYKRTLCNERRVAVAGTAGRAAATTS